MFLHTYYLMSQCFCVCVPNNTEYTGIQLNTTQHNILCAFEQKLSLNSSGVQQGRGCGWDDVAK